MPPAADCSSSPSCVGGLVGSLCVSLSVASFGLCGRAAEVAAAVALLSTFVLTLLASLPDSLSLCVFLCLLLRQGCRNCRSCSCSFVLPQFCQEVVVHGYHGNHAGSRTLPRPPVLLGRLLPQAQTAAKLQAAKSSLLAKLVATTHSLKPVAKAIAPATAARCCSCQVQPPVAVAAGVALAVFAAVAAAAVALGLS